jgi:hypothetical protein
MTVTTRHVETFEDAVALAFCEAQVEGMAAEVAYLFAPLIERSTFQHEVEKLTTASVKKKYGRDARWRIYEWWLVPMPSPRYEAKGLPSLLVDTKVYAVASVRAMPVSPSQPYHVTVVEFAGKLPTTQLPLKFLQAMLDGTVDGYYIAGIDGSWVSYEVTGLKHPLRLNRDFLDRLRQVFQRKSVAAWLEGFGFHGRRVMPVVVGTMLGMIYGGASEASPPGQPPLNRETLVNVVTSLGYSTAEAQQVFKWSEPDIKAGMTLEEATLIMLRHIAKGG